MKPNQLPVPLELAQMLSKEIMKDLHPNEVYTIAENLFAVSLHDKYNLDALRKEYEERYDYVFEMYNEPPK